MMYTKLTTTEKYMIWFLYSYHDYRAKFLAKQLSYSEQTIFRTVRVIDQLDVDEVINAIGPILSRMTATEWLEENVT